MVPAAALVGVIVAAGEVVAAVDETVAGEVAGATVGNAVDVVVARCVLLEHPMAATVDARPTNTAATLRDITATVTVSRTLSGRKLHIA